MSLVSITKTGPIWKLQPPRYDDSETADRVATPGVSVGLVWTSFGGEVQFVEATAMVGKGDLHLTGQLGDVIKESAQIALTWVYLFSFVLHASSHALFSYVTIFTCYIFLSSTYVDVLIGKLYT